MDARLLRGSLVRRHGGFQRFGRRHGDVVLLARDELPAEEGLQPLLLSPSVFKLRLVGMLVQ